MTKSFLPTVNSIKRRWYEVDATGKTLGRLSTRIAIILRGKHKPVFTPHMDLGDFVVVVNPDKIRFTGRKLDQKSYFRFSGYPGGLRSRSLREMMDKYPDRVVIQAVRQMLSKNRLRDTMLKRLRVIKGSGHNYKIDEKLD